MRKDKLDPEQSQASILAAARLLFAERGFTGVSVRDIAQASGVTHGLVHHYFGSKDDLIAEVMRREVRVAAESAAQAFARENPTLSALRDMMRYYMTEGRTSVLLVVRAEIDGLRPESMLAEADSQPLGLLTAAVRELQEQAGSPPPVDPALVAAYLGAVVFAFATSGPWLLNAVGLPDADFDAKVDQVAALSARFIAAATGVQVPESAAAEPDAG